MDPELRHRPEERADPFGICGRVVDGRYRVECVVGQGGFGVVYRAHHTGFDSPVALKVLRLPGRAVEGEAFAQRFLLEGKLLFNLASLHPSIVRVFEMGMLDRRDRVPAPFLALEWLEGHSLDAVLEQRRAARLAAFSLDEALGLLAGPVEALARAHGARVVHRDVKPANLFVAEQNGLEVTKLLDFGLAKAMGASSTTSELYDDSAFEQRALTPSYAAPEQWLQRLGATGAWTDVYALALVFVELLSLERPLRGEDGAQLMAACVDPSFRPTPRALGVAVSEAVEHVFRRALAVEPRGRYRDAGEFWSALCQAAGRSHAVASGVREAPRLRAQLRAAHDLALAATSDRTLPEPGFAPQPAHISENSARVPERPRRALGVAMLLALAALLALWLTWRSASSRLEQARPPVAAAPGPSREQERAPRSAAALPAAPVAAALPAPLAPESPKPLPLPRIEPKPPRAPRAVAPKPRAASEPVPPGATEPAAGVPDEGAAPPPAPPLAEETLRPPSAEDLLLDAELTHRR
jgi:serine/threonine protein kinase